MDKKTLNLLIEIGKDAEKGLICNHCGKKFRKALGHVRACKKCREL